MNLLRRYAADIRIGLLVAGAIALLGVPIGVGWELVAPVTEARVEGNQIFFDDPYYASYIAADRWFGVLVAGAGLVCGVVAYLVSRDRWGVATAFGLVAGGLAASAIAWKLGYWLGPGDGIAQARDVPDGAVLVSLTLRSRVFLLLWPIAAISAFLTLNAAIAPAKEPAAQPLMAHDPARPDVASRV